MISYFCVSTEQRFINMSSEKERHNGAGSLIEKTNRSLLNNSGQSQSIKSAGMSPGGLNSTLGKSTKTSTLKQISVFKGTEKKQIDLPEDDPLAITASVNTESRLRSFNQEQQEYFLAKALHFGIIYLPSESPLVQHLTQNYIKNYLQKKMEEREEMINKFLN